MTKKIMLFSIFVSIYAAVIWYAENHMYEDNLRSLEYLYDKELKLANAIEKVEYHSATLMVEEQNKLEDIRDSIERLEKKTSNSPNVFKGVSLFIWLIPCMLIFYMAFTNND